MVLGSKTGRLEGVILNVLKKVTVKRSKTLIRDLSLPGNMVTRHNVEFGYLY